MGQAGALLLLLLLLLLLALLREGRGAALHVEPPGPVVAVAAGASLMLTCRLACAERAAAVRWWGLDTNLGAMEPGERSSVLWVRAASPASAGTRVCRGSCGARSLQRSVQLQVFDFPDRLTASPAALAAGRDSEVACTARNVTPAHPGALTLSLLLEGRELAGALALGREEAEEPLPDAEEPLFSVTERWRLPPLPTPGPAALHCRATMRLPGVELSHLLAIPVLHSSTPHYPVLPDSTTKELLVTTPEATTILEATTWKGTTTSEATTPTPEATPGQGSTTHAGSPSPTPGNSSVAHCRPEIRRFPSPGGVELLCEATCGPSVAVHWTQAPGGLAAFPRQETGARAWLTLHWAGCTPEGWFQCRLDPGGHMASLYLTPETCSSPMPAGLWPGSLVLGLLLLLALLSRRRWSRCRRPR
ncbi:mucosal addressin cell adhesion molecule 1 [Erinaceus europaeus]|uniref:Mucosal addressin cell adhesion molecule 1 n=1 Tax=Erinaceus europaeus TaxID=9365 RepID=A0ABM3WLG8_ERIEU|nr:mucosal addressin cell adhesion molecule 1 [Erinaceus europaeus]